MSGRCLVALTVILAACAAAPEAAEQDVVAPALDSGGAAARPHQATRGPEPVTAPISLPACDLAADRVVDCAVDACAGYDWTTAGHLATAWHAVCDGPLAAAALNAPSCPAVAEVAGSAVGDYQPLCESNPCTQGCQKLGACLVSECAAFAETLSDTVAADCADGCVPDDIAWVLAAETCADVVQPIAAANEQFAAACEGGSLECAAPDACDAYGAKISGCMVEHCDGHLDAWASGLTDIFTAFCSDPGACPDVDAVAFMTDPALTCDAPALVDVGKGPPFGGLCAGGGGVGPDEALAACEVVLACPGTDGAGSAAACAVWLAVREDAAQRAACLLATGGDCVAVWACLEGW